MNANMEIKKPLIRYAGSAAETSIGSKPIGNELGTQSSKSLADVKLGRASRWEGAT